MKTHIFQFLLDSAEYWPHHPAVEDSSKSLTHLQLLASSIKLASYLQAHGIRRGTPIVIFIPKSCDALAAILSATIVGGIYVPLDITAPTARLVSQIERLGSCALLCIKATQSEALFLESPGCEVICIDNLLCSYSEPSDFSCLQQIATNCITGFIDTDPCYVIFTSGSTGAPKGVTISHRSVIDYIQWALGEYPIDESSRFASQAPFYFDNSTLDIYLTLASGACLCIPPDGTFIFPRLALQFLNASRISTIFWVPSLLISIANSGLLDEFTPMYLRHVLFAGEQMPVHQINQWVRALPGALFSNLYGPTEITVDCTFFTFYEEFEGSRLPIGFPCRNTDVLLLDELGGECDNLEEGEVCVRGSSLSLGYWNDICQSDKVFVQNPLQPRFRDLIYRTGDIAWRDEHGCFTLVGRRDLQIKLNGYRIELGEIETAALSITGVGNCAAIYDNSKNIIVLFVSLACHSAISVVDLRKNLTGLIPKYMMPSNVVTLEQLPLTPNGKVDRHALRGLC